MEKKQITSPLKAIRAYCLGCAGTSNEVKLCPAEKCELHEWRFGHNPFRKSTMTEEQRAAAVERLRKAREAKHENRDA
jgi:hypothetical protein